MVNLKVFRFYVNYDEFTGLLLDVDLRLDHPFEDFVPPLGKFGFVRGHGIVSSWRESV